MSSQSPSGEKCIRTKTNNWKLTTMISEVYFSSRSINISFSRHKTGTCLPAPQMTDFADRSVPCGKTLDFSRFLSKIMNTWVLTLWHISCYVSTINITFNYQYFSTLSKLFSLVLLCTADTLCWNRTWEKSNLCKIWGQELSVYAEKNLARNDLYDIGWDKNLVQCKKKNMEPDSCHLMSH